MEAVLSPPASDPVGELCETCGDRPSPAVCRYCGSCAHICVPFQRCDHARAALASCQQCGDTCRDADGVDTRQCCAFCLLLLCGRCLHAHRH
jgi:hypothetical protein